MLIWLILLIAGPWLIVGLLLVAQKLRRESHVANSTGEQASDYVTLGNPGPWGRMEYIRIALELPDELVFVPGREEPPVRWFFKGSTKDAAVALLRSAELTPAQLDALVEKAPWSTGADGSWVTPGDDLILGLSPASRAKIYAGLVEFPENLPHVDPVCFRPEVLEERLAQSEMAPASIELLRGLLYQNDARLLLFADVGPALRRLPNDYQRRQLIKTVSGKPALLARLKVDAHSDVNALAQYWGVGGRRKDLEPLLESLKEVPGGNLLNIVCLLPPFAREHLYNHPFTSVDAGGVKQDCFWSAMNLFNEKPDDRFVEMDYVHQVLNSDYYNIAAPSQLGDVVFLATKNNVVVHAAAYIADDVVFTKNGISYTQPWLLMHMDDMLNTYAVRYPASGPLKPLYYRKKAL
jgi:hypothetical protein